MGQNTLKRFQQKIQDLLSSAPDAETEEETAEESIVGGVLCCVHSLYNASSPTVVSPHLHSSLHNLSIK